MKNQDFVSSSLKIYTSATFFLAARGSHLGGANGTEDAIVLARLFGDGDRSEALELRLVRTRSFKCDLSHILKGGVGLCIIFRGLPRRS